MSDSTLALVTPAGMAEIDRRTILAGTPGPVLMERAGAAVAGAIRHYWPRQPLTILCGPGNNGGDGFVVARLLAADGWPIRVGLMGSVDRLIGDARHHARLWTGAVEPLSPDLLAGAGLVVDALFGAGLNRPLAADITAFMQQIRVPIVAIDVPSGLDGATGADLGAVAAAVTVTFGPKKPGHLLLPGRMLCGSLIQADIGLDAAAIRQISTDLWENAPALWAAALPQPGLAGHKYDRGHALIFGGYPMTGAARLAAYGAARAGAGLTTLAVPAAGFEIYATAMTSIMVRSLPDPVQDPAPQAQLLSDRRFSAVLIGPGAGSGAGLLGQCLALLDSGRAFPGRGIVLDADALNAAAAAQVEFWSRIAGPVVLTPHEGEFRRVFPALTGSKLDRARLAAAASGAVVILKGADTVVAAPDGRAVINSNAPPWLATAGSGDVLAGIVTGHLAQGMPAFEAAASAVWLHGAAAAAHGPGLLAEDLPGLLPAISRDINPALRSPPGVQR